MKYLDLELEGQMGLSKKVYENVDFDKSLLRTEINLGYVGAGKKEGIGLGDALRILEDSSRYINHGKCTLRQRLWILCVRRFRSLQLLQQIRE